jgi:hypothetical protein
MAGCSAGTPAPTLPYAALQTERAEAAGALLYVTDVKTRSVVVFTYPSGKIVQTLTGFIYPQGECVDAAGDVWIVDLGTSKITEYAHGASMPAATISDSGQDPTGCAVNPKTGDLAIANIATSSLEPGSISIFPHAGGTPENYVDANLAIADSVAYDDRGNLFVAGTDPQQFYYGEIPSGIRALHQLHWPKAVAGGGIMWDGRHIAVANAITSVEIGLGFPIYRLAGNRIAGTTYPGGACNFFWFSVDRNQLICPDGPGKSIQIYAYPKGGPATATIVDSNIKPVAAVVSR